MEFDIATYEVLFQWAVFHSTSREPGNKLHRQFMDEAQRFVVSDQVRHSSWERLFVVSTSNHLTVVGSKKGIKWGKKQRKFSVKPFVNSELSLDFQTKCSNSAHVMVATAIDSSLCVFLQKNCSEMTKRSSGIFLC